MDLNSTVMSLAILSALPIAAYAVWADYFTRSLAEKERIREPIDAPTVQLSSRLAALGALFFQFGIYLGSQDLRAQAPTLGYLFFVSAVLIQIGLQNRVDRQIQPKPKPRLSAVPDPDRAPAASVETTGSSEVALRAFIWATAGGALYLAVMISGVLLFALPGRLLGLPDWANTLCILIGGALGVGMGLLVNFALGAYHLKKILPVTPIADDPLRTLLTECFSQHGLTAPEFWRVETERAREASALIAGFNGGRSIFRPGLFLSRSAIDALSPTELSAVVLHEVAHLKLRHLRTRLLSSAGLIVGLTMAATFTVFLSLLVLPEGAGRTLVSYASAAGAMILSFRSLAAQSRSHELEADRYAVERLHADPSAMIEALRKFDRINQVGAGPGLKLGTHPSTAERVLALEAMIVSETGVSSRSRESEKRVA